MTKDQIWTEAMALNRCERDEVAEALWQSIEREEFSSGQVAEVRRRIVALDTGQVQATPGEEVMRELRQRFQR